MNDAFSQAWDVVKNQRSPDEYYGGILPNGTECPHCGRISGRDMDNLTERKLRVFEHPITQIAYCDECYQFQPYPEVDGYDPSDPDWEDKNTYDWKEDPDVKDGLDALREMGRDDE